MLVCILASHALAEILYPTPPSYPLSQPRLQIAPNLVVQWDPPVDKADYQRVLILPRLHVAFNIFIRISEYPWKES
jgi:hypothetical protein